MRLKIAAQIASALQYLHSVSPSPIIHRDIKPANFFLGPDLDAKLGDVGLASAAHNPPTSSSSSSRRPGDEAVGTWAYLAPEYKSQGQSSVKTDVYAYGISLLQLLTAARESPQLLDQSRKALQHHQLSSLLDSRGGNWEPVVAERVLRLALWCAMDKPEDRPHMAAIATELLRICQALDVQT